MRIDNLDDHFNEFKGIDHYEQGKGREGKGREGKGIDHYEHVEFQV